MTLLKVSAGIKTIMKSHFLFIGMGVIKNPDLLDTIKERAAIK